jgi:Tfp pilus assembly protein PilZ
MAHSSRPAEPSDKRNAQRRRVRTKVRFWNEDGEFVAFTSDVSDNGVLVETARKLPIGTRLHIEVELGDRSYFSEATVARRRDSPAYGHSFFKPALGLRFLGLLEAVEQLARQRRQMPGAASGPLAVEEPAPDAASVEEDDFAPPVLDLRDPALLRSLYERDLRKGALLVDLRRPAELGEPIAVVLLLPPPNGDITVCGRVVSMFSGSTQVGLLLDERKEIDTRLTQLLETLE